jgi:hypothetical protein
MMMNQCATDTKQIKVVLNAVNQTILAANLKDSVSGVFFLSFLAYLFLLGRSTE